MKYTNTLYTPLREYVKKHHGYNTKDFYAHPLGGKYKTETQNIKNLFGGKRVRLKYSSTQDFVHSGGEETGRIKIFEGTENPIRFYKGKKRSQYKSIDLGLHEGFYATIIPSEIEEL